MSGNDISSFDHRVYTSLEDWPFTSAAVLAKLMNANKNDMSSETLIRNSESVEQVEVSIKRLLEKKLIKVGVKGFPRRYVVSKKKEIPVDEDEDYSEDETTETQEPPEYNEFDDTLEYNSDYPTNTLYF